MKIVFSGGHKIETTVNIFLHSYVILVVLPTILRKFALVLLVVYMCAIISNAILNL